VQLASKAEKLHSKNARSMSYYIEHQDKYGAASAGSSRSQDHGGAELSKFKFIDEKSIWEGR
jgi:hypothetical protein